MATPRAGVMYDTLLQLSLFLSYVYFFLLQNVRCFPMTETNILFFHLFFCLLIFHLITISIFSLTKLDIFTRDQFVPWSLLGNLHLNVRTKRKKRKIRKLFVGRNSRIWNKVNVERNGINNLLHHHNPLITINICLPTFRTLIYWPNFIQFSNSLFRSVFEFYPGIFYILRE